MHSFKKIINQSINTCSLLHRGEEIQVLNQNGFHLAAQEFLEGKVPDVTQGHRFAFSGNLPGAISRTVQLSSTRRHHKKHSFIISPLTVLEFAHICNSLLRKTKYSAFFWGYRRDGIWAFLLFAF